MNSTLQAAHQPHSENSETQAVIYDETMNSSLVEICAGQPENSEAKVKRLQKSVLEITRTTYNDVERRKKAFYQALA